MTAKRRAKADPIEGEIERGLPEDGARDGASGLTRFGKESIGSEKPTGAEGDLDSERAKRAAVRATELEFGAFRDAVLPFIDMGVRSFYDTPAAWSAMQERVATCLLELV